MFFMKLPSPYVTCFSTQDLHHHQIWFRKGSIITRGRMYTFDLKFLVLKRLAISQDS